MNRGFSLLEVLIAASLVGGVVLFASTSMNSMTTAGHHGATQLEAVSNNQRPLLFMANDLQSASSDSDPDTGQPRYKIEVGAAIVGLRSKHEVAAGTGDGYEKINRTDIDTVDLAEDRDTAEERFDAKVLGTGQARARDSRVTNHSIFTFSKVNGYTIDPETGEVGPIWSSPIMYTVNENRQLIRLKDGQEKVIGRKVTLFHVAMDDLGNFIITLVTEQHDSRSGGVVQMANRVEVHPKNK